MRNTPTALLIARSSGAAALAKSALTFGNGGNMHDDNAADVAICYITQLPVGEQECPLGKDECDDCCEEYFIAYSG